MDLITLNTLQSLSILIYLDVGSVNSPSRNAEVAVAKDAKYIPIKFDLPEEHVRAVRARAGIDNVNPRDIVVLALNSFLSKEIAEARQRMSAAEKPSEDGGKKGRAKG